MKNYVVKIGILFKEARMLKVLVVATSRKTRGGITSVVKAHEMGRQWKKYRCRWIETHRDGNIFIKMLYLIVGLTKAMFLLPRYDLVHIHMSEPVSALRKLPVMVWARLWRKKTIVHFHSFSPATTIYGKYRKVYGFMFYNADRVIVLSCYWRKIVVDEFGLDDKVIVVYNPCMAQTNQFVSRNRNGYSDIVFHKKQYILYAGTVNARKGYVDMIRAFAIIADKHSDWMIVFAGNGEVEKGRRLAESLGIAEKTLFLGWVTGKEKERVFSEATVFCLPSYAEGFPMAVLDAWSYGLPVITTPVGGIPDVARDGENMLLFDPGDITGLARQMERMITEDDLRRNIAKKSVKLADTVFNINTINTQLDHIYTNLLDM